MTLIIDMCSGTGELGRAVAAGLDEPTQILTLSDSYGPARKYLKHRFPGIEVHKDFRDQDVPRGSIVTIGAPCQDLSVAGKHAGAERGSGTHSSLIHEALDKAVAGGADLIVAENVPGGFGTYLDLANWLETEHHYRATVSSAGAWEVGAPTAASASCSSLPGSASSPAASTSSDRSNRGTWCPHQPHRPRPAPAAPVEPVGPTFKPGSTRATASPRSIPSSGCTSPGSPSLASRMTPAD